MSFYLRIAPIKITLITDHLFHINYDRLHIIRLSNDRSSYLERSLGFEENDLRGEFLGDFFREVSQNVEKILASANGKEIPCDVERNPIPITTQIKELTALSEMIPKITDVVFRAFVERVSFPFNNAYHDYWYVPLKKHCDKLNKLSNSMKETTGRLKETAEIREQIFYKENRLAITHLLNSHMAGVLSSLTLSYLSDS